MSESLSKRIDDILSRFEKELVAVKDLEQLDEMFRNYVGRKGFVRGLTSELTKLSVDEKRVFGPKINSLKDDLTIRLEQKRADLRRSLEESRVVDYTLPSERKLTGREHPIMSTFAEIIACLERLGFEVVEGPEIELEENNFDKLNIPKEHPSHDIWNTFFLSNGMVMRSHTSPVQIRTMMARKPPLKIAAPGKVFRPDAVDAGHLPVFHQVEGLYVDEKVTLPQLKGTLESIAHQLFGSVETRFRTSFFPFTEPSLEMDVSCIICKKKGCPTCRYSSWIEILGAGMVNKKVFERCGYKEDYSGFAFGLGVERITMIRYQIDDIRHFIDNNFRFLRHFF